MFKGLGVDSLEVLEGNDFGTGLVGDPKISLDVPVIGSVAYVNVSRPISYRGTALVSMSKTEDGELRPSFLIRSADGHRVIAEVQTGEVSLVDSDAYVLRSSNSRVLIFEKRTAKRVLDISNDRSGRYRVAALLHTADGFPITLHPDRTVIGDKARKDRVSMIRSSISPQLGQYPIGISVGNTDKRCAFEAPNVTAIIMQRCLVSNVTTGLEIAL